VQHVSQRSFLQLIFTLALPILTGLGPTLAQTVDQFDWVQPLPAEPVYQTTDAQRNVYVLTANNTVLQFDAAGREQWRQTFGNWPAITKIAVDQGGNLLLAGQFTGNAVAGDSVFVAPSSTAAYLFVGSVSANRRFRWAVRYRYTAAGGSVGGLRVDAANTVWLSGSLTGAVLLANLSASGVRHWDRIIYSAPALNSDAPALKISNDRQAYLAINTYSRSITDAFVSRSDSVASGVAQPPGLGLGNGYNQILRDLSLDRELNCYSLSEYALVDRTAGQTLERGQMVLKTDAVGKTVWRKQGPFVADSAQATGLLTDRAGSLVLYGRYQGRYIDNTIPPRYQPDDYISLAAYSATGELRWTTRFNSATGNDKLYQTERDANGALLLTGSTSGPLKLGLRTITGQANAPAYYVAKLQPAQLQPDTTTRFLCAGGAVALPGRYAGYFESELLILLSDSSGSFAQASVIGRIPIGTAGRYFAGPTVTPTVTLPDELPPGTRYRLRVVSGEPEFVSEPLAITVGAAPAAPTISQSATGLVSSEAQGNQWFTARGELIAGATARQFQPNQGGQYYVTASAGGCRSKPSELFTYLVTVIEPPAVANLTIYPNPATDRVLIDWTGVSATADARLLLHDSQGRLLRQTVRDGQLTILSINELPTGIYLITAQVDGQALTTRRLVIR
jgi:hypothetical protein